MPRINEPSTEPLRYFAVAIDETSCWTLDSMNPKPDRIMSSYLCSPDIGIHICSFTPSTEMRRIDTWPEWSVEPDDEVAQHIREHVAEEAMRADENRGISYFDRSDVLHKCEGLRAFLDETSDGVPENASETRFEKGRTWVYVASQPPGLSDEDARSWVEELYESVRDNPVM